MHTGRHPEWGNIARSMTGAAHAETFTHIVEATKPVYEWFYKDLPEDTSGWAREMVEKIREVGASIEEGEWFVTE